MAFLGDFFFLEYVTACMQHTYKGTHKINKKNMQNFKKTKQKTVMAVSCVCSCVFSSPDWTQLQHCFLSSAFFQYTEGSENLSVQAGAVLISFNKVFHLLHCLTRVKKEKKDGSTWQTNQDIQF